jgi:hypothetical protein
MLTDRFSNVFTNILQLDGGGTGRQFRMFLTNISLLKGVGLAGKIMTYDRKIVFYKKDSETSWSRFPGKKTKNLCCPLELIDRLCAIDGIFDVLFLF